MFAVALLPEAVDHMQSVVLQTLSTDCKQMSEIGEDEDVKD